jgi:hypothetical protein
MLCPQAISAAVAPRPASTLAATVASLTDVTHVYGSGFTLGRAVVVSNPDAVQEANVLGADDSQLLRDGRLTRYSAVFSKDSRIYLVDNIDQFRSSASASCLPVLPTLIASTLGIAVSQTPHAARDRQELVCSYWLPGKGYGVTITVIRHQTAADLERDYRLARTAKGEKASRLSGIGNAAILVTVGSQQRQYRVIAVLDGKSIFTVGDLTYKSTLARDEALARKLVPLERS